MTATLPIDVAVPAAPSERSLLEQAFSRAAGTPRVTGNSVRLLRNAAENYPAWLEAIAAAERTVHFETYIIWDDESGATFADALSAKAREGVDVRVLYDWLGAVGKTPRRFWDSMLRAGAQVRCFNPPRFASPLGSASGSSGWVIRSEGSSHGATPDSICADLPSTRWSARSRERGRSRGPPACPRSRSHSRVRRRRATSPCV